MNRIVGLETEYGCLTSQLPVSPGAVARVRDWIFAGQRYGLIDVHQRDWDEPAGNGGFLFNGGRAYVDMGHLEYCTPECLSLLDVLAYDQAGDAMLTHALNDLKLTREVSFIRNNVDHYSGATFGCHENYLLRRTAPLTELNVQSLLTFLTLRVLYSSSGRVGGIPTGDHRLEIPLPGHQSQFQISQRADYINNDLFEWVQFNRAIINTRDEPLADAQKYRRLHLLHGDTSVLPATLLLKVGTTSLVLDLLETDSMPKFVLADAVSTFRQLSHNPDGPWLVPLANGKSAGAVEILHQYHEAAARQFKGRDRETDDLIKIWGETLETLITNRDALVGKIDWITKRFILEKFMEQENIPWNDPWLKSQDLEFHHIDPARSLGLALAQTPAPWLVSETEIEKRMLTAPSNTRASIRSKAMGLMREHSTDYFIDWEILGSDGVPPLQMLNPFESELDSNSEWRPHATKAVDSIRKKNRAQDEKR